MSELVMSRAGRVAGTEGYAERAETLVTQWKTISFAESHGPILHLIPAAPCRIVDIGAGIGSDAAGLAAMGHQVVAVEPTDELRLPGMALYPSPNITWLKDSLPELAVLLAREERFDVVMLSAVWMHLDASQRLQAMPRLAGLMRDSGTAIMSLRHGPIPAGRRMFDVSADETIQLAAAQGLAPVLNLTTPSVQAANRLAGVTWTRLAFVKASRSS